MGPADPAGHSLVAMTKSFQNLYTVTDIEADLNSDELLSLTVAVG